MILFVPYSSKIQLLVYYKSEWGGKGTNQHVQYDPIFVK